MTSQQQIHQNTSLQKKTCPPGRPKKVTKRDAHTSESILKFVLGSRSKTQGHREVQSVEDAVNTQQVIQEKMIVLDKDSEEQVIDLDEVAIRMNNDTRPIVHVHENENETIYKNQKRQRTDIVITEGYQTTFVTNFFNDAQVATSCVVHHPQNEPQSETPCVILQQGPRNVHQPPWTPPKADNLFERMASNT